LTPQKLVSEALLNARGVVTRDERGGLPIEHSVEALVPLRVEADTQCPTERG
jgi:hypothetical protein